MSTTTRDDHAGSSRGNSVEGSTFFAGMMLSILAVFQVFQGIGAIAGDDVYVRGLNYTFEFDLTTWGWIHLIVGLVALATGIGLTMGQSWASLVGLVIAFLSAVSSFAFLPYYPLWSLVILAFDVFVIWAICTQAIRNDAR